jgi:GntR family transcriptional regulator / MocR family aminotransferase
MRLPLDRQSRQPLYQQVADHFRNGILSGSLSTGTRLPATRQLAQDLGVNRITIENAYAELEAEGLILARVGSGTFVLPPTPLPLAQPRDNLEPWPIWQQQLSTPGSVVPTQGISVSAPNVNVIDFSDGIGDSQHFPVDEFRKVIQTVIRRDGIEAMAYGDRRGYPPLRDTIAHILANQGLQVSAENILITTGSQQAIALVSQLLLKPGDVILVEMPTYSGALELFKASGFEPVGIPMDEGGMCIAEIERLIQQVHPKLIYSIPNFQNPTGTCLDSQRRRQLITLADRYNLPILEDDFVGDLRYDGRAQPSLKALDPGGRVIYISTFTKMLMPGLRVGFLVAEGPVYESLIAQKYVIDLDTSSLIQRALEAYVTIGRFQAHLRRSRQTYRQRRDAMLRAIERYLPAGVRVQPPLGGLFIWMQLPEGMSCSELVPLAQEAAICFAAGTKFFPQHSQGEAFLRLNFVTQREDTIEEGIRRLGQALQRLSENL